MSYGVHKAFKDSSKDEATKKIIVEIMEFVTEKFEEDDKKISNEVVNRAAKDQRQFEADDLMGISASLSTYGCIGSYADVEKVGLFL